jgi:response regulator of citrate/malate metabolism
MDPIKLTFNTPRLKKLKTVYIIEDNPVERTMLVDFLSKYPQLSIKEFPNGDVCVKEMVVSNLNPDLILLDYFLDSDITTSKDGLEILTKLKEISPNSEVIMLTSIENERITTLARKKGAMYYVVKGPASYEKIDSILQNNFIIE